MLRRSGVSLIEVLVAIFVTALGLLALLALFPLGAVTMAQAIKDTRTAQAAANAAAGIKAWPISQPHPPTLPNQPPVYVYAPIHNDYFVTKGYAGSDVLPAPNPNGPSYAVYVDPMGVDSYSSVPGGFVGWVGGPPKVDGTVPRGPGLPRQTISLFNPSQLPPTLDTAYIRDSFQRRKTLLSWFSLLDDITFNPSGLPLVPKPPAVATVQRENRYSWAYLLRRPRFSDPSVVEMTIAVYDRRPLVLLSDTDKPVGGSLFLPVGENAYAVESDPTDPLNTVSLVYGGGLQKPALRPGGWILDATPLPGHGYFYRVVSVSDAVSATGQPAVKLELQENVRTLTAAVPKRPIFSQAVVMDNLAEVFERGPVAVP